MTLNPRKCHCTVIGSKDLSHKIMLNNNEITSSNEEKLSVILSDNKLNFESHVTSLCRKAGQSCQDVFLGEGVLEICSKFTE